MSNAKKLIYYVFLFSVTVVWGLGFVFTKQVIAYLSPSLLLIMRFSSSALLTFFISFKELVKLNKKQWLNGVFAGLSLGLGFVLQTYCMMYTSSSNAALITGLYVVMVPFFQWLLEKKRPGVKSFIAAILAFTGIAILAGGGFSKLNIGDLMCFFASICFAIHCIIIDKATKDTDAMSLNFIQMLTSAILCAFVGLVFDFDNLKIIEFPKEIIFPLLSLCILSTTYAYIVQTNAQKHLPPSNVSLILSLECTFGALFSVMMGLDSFTWYLGVSMALMAIAIYISEGNFKRKNNAPDNQPK